MNTNRIKCNWIVLLCVLLFFIVLALRMTQLSLSKTIDGINIKAFAAARNNKKEVIFAKEVIYTIMNLIY